MAEKKKLSLEESMDRLEDIVSQLENDKLSLDKSLKLYEEAVKIVGKCSAELEAAKRKIQILQSGKDGQIEIVDMHESSFAE